MRLIDFDKEFMNYTSKWVKKNASRFRNADEIEAHMPEMYMEWLNQPAEWLDGEKPGMYFSQFSDARELTDWFVEYETNGVSVPDQLLERIVDLGEDAVAPLMEVAQDEGRDTHIRVTAVNMLLQLGTDKPMDFCLDVIDRREEDDDLADACAELLEALNLAAVRPILERMDGASDQAMETYLDLLSNFPGDERVFEYTLSGFKNRPEKRALYASYLAKLGDSRAEPVLRQALTLSDLTYLDYLEIVNAIEELGGEEVPSNLRSFDGDPYFESMKRL